MDEFYKQRLEEEEEIKRKEEEKRKKLEEEEKLKMEEKQRCGVVNLSDNKYILYILSPCEFSQKFYINPKKHLLGILVDATVEPTRQQITIPPPVISLTEKRRLLSRNKKNENKKEATYFIRVLLR